MQCLTSYWINQTCSSDLLEQSLDSLLISESLTNSSATPHSSTLHCSLSSESKRVLTELLISNWVYVAFVPLHRKPVTVAPAVAEHSNYKHSSHCCVWQDGGSSVYGHCLGNAVVASLAAWRSDCCLAREITFATLLLHAYIQSRGVLPSNTRHNINMYIS
jgi:hypothetical protein